MHFRQAKDKDQEKIIELYKQFNQDRVKAGVGDAGYQILDGPIPWIKTLTDPDYTTFVVTKKNLVLGFITVRKSNIKKFKRIPKLMEIDLTVVDNRIRRRGIGTYLYKNAKKYMKSQGATHALLNVLETNTVAMNFWKKMGYNTVSKTIYERVDGVSEDTCYMMAKI